MNVVYVWSIVALAVIVLTIVVLCRERLKHVDLRFWKVGATIDLSPAPGDTPPHAGGIDLDRNEFKSSKLTTPKDADLSMRDNKLDGSTIEVRDSGPSQDD
jgi:hypothetical protein